MILVDSSVWIDYFNGTLTPETDRLDQLLDYQFLVMGDLILTEVLQGFRKQSDFDQAKKLLTELETFSLCSPSLALASADNFRKLRQRGITIRKTIDVIIATWCIEHNASLLHSDRDFQPFVEHLHLKTVL
ncbi:type II toxin-antitoxin system VapC family toxin [Endozoicomonas ascidiicola]|uniref:type II toxin-antitoxin system VapC family toxin n=1 Tax=Endozoicomonas ascidiicola TaxID=1698521 RepID=UPI00082B07EE|nr:PIN domain nuclease [Endozoicomonas ascidiicola]